MYGIMDVGHVVFRTQYKKSLPSITESHYHVSKMNWKSCQTMGGLVSMAITFRIHLLRSLKASAVDTTAQYKQLTGVETRRVPV